MELQRSDSSATVGKNGCSRTPSIVKFSTNTADNEKLVNDAKQETRANALKRTGVSNGSFRLGDAKPVPIVRIATQVKLKTITHKVKRPAVDIEFHDLVYTTKTNSGEFNT